MGRTDLFREGARLPEELSRLLFLEPVLGGRRVLEVGARSDAVARFLIELGASRVVCAHEDKDLVERLRAENDLERVDFRVVRPGVLPGDDGAFDLVIDFSLSEALAAGQTFRLTDIGRLLSEDGFAVTALHAEGARGLGALLGGSPTAPLLGGERSAAGIGAGPLGYRGLVEALKLQFDVVQVYFQSLLLGYLFGSFDVEPGGDGVSPNTSLMGDQAEPAGHYLFSFGNAVPVIEDVALVQVPFGALLEEVGPRAAAEPTSAERTDEGNALGAAEGAPAGDDPASLPAESELAVATEAPPAEADGEREALREQARAQEEALLEIAGRMERLRGDIAALVETLETRTRERDELQAFVEGLEAGVAARDATVAALQDDKARLAGAVGELERFATAGRESQVAMEGAAAELLDLRGERAQLVEHIARVEGELVTLQNRARVLEEAHELSILRVNELEGALLTAEAQRSDVEVTAAGLRARLAEDHERARAERALLEAALATHQAQVLSLERALDEARALLERERVALSEAQSQAERDGVALAHQRADTDVLVREREQLAQVAADYGRDLEERTRELELIRARSDEHIVELRERLRRIEEDAAQTVAAHLEEVVALKRRREELEADAHRLAEGVKTLVREREELRDLADQHRARAEEAQDRARLLDERLAAAQQSFTEAQEGAAGLRRSLEEREKRQRAAQAALEEAQKQLVAAREGLQEIAGQRDTLKQVVAAREREIASLKDELGASSAELARGREQSEVQQKGLAEARQRLSAIEVERAQHRRREEELGTKNLQVLGELERSRGELEELKATHAAQLELARTSLQEGIERERSSLRAHADQERASLRAQLEQDRSALLDQLEEASEQTEDAASQVARAEEELRVARLEHAEDRAALERTATRAALLEATLDEATTALSRQATQLTIVQVSLEEGRSDYDRKHAEAAMLRAALSEARSLLDVERARGDLFFEELSEAQHTLGTERARGDLRQAELEEAQQHISELRQRAKGALEASRSREAATGVRAELAQEILAEAQERLARERTRAELLDAQLSEAQQVAADARAYASLLSAELDDARRTFQLRRAEQEAALEAERLRAAAAINDIQSAHEQSRVTEAALAVAKAATAAKDDELGQRLRGAGAAIAGLEGELKVLKEQHAETRSETVLKLAEIERLSATLASAERERDSLLADSSAHQARAAAESQKRISADEELTRLRVAHNQALAEVQRMKTDLEAGKRAPEVEAELSSLKQRVEGLEKDNSLKDAEIADKLQRIKQMNERLEQLTDRLGRVETYRS